MELEEVRLGLLLKNPQRNDRSNQGDLDTTPRTGRTWKLGKLRHIPHQDNPDSHSPTRTSKENQEPVQAMVEWRNRREEENHAHQMEGVERCPHYPSQKPVQRCQKHLLQCHTRGKNEKLE